MAGYKIIKAPVITNNTEGYEHLEAVEWVRQNHHEIAKILIHPENEGRRTHMQAATSKAKGMNKGASDIIIPAGIGFCCEIKRTDGGDGGSKEQKAYLEAAAKLGAMCYIAHGKDAFIIAFNEWLEALENRAFNNTTGE